LGSVTASSDEQLVDAVLAAIEKNLEDPCSLDGLSQTEADLLAVATAKGVIGNGGHCYWFEGKDGDETLRVAQSFERMGLEAAAAALRQSLGVFPSGLPPRDLGERQEYVSAHRAELNAAFEPLDEIIWETEFTPAAARYILLNRKELLTIHPGLSEYLALH
jgi:hypothetical protein